MATSSVKFKKKKCNQVFFKILKIIFYYHLIKSYIFSLKRINFSIFYFLNVYVKLYQFYISNSRNNIKINVSY
jgi:hypothetical protein